VPHWPQFARSEVRSTQWPPQAVGQTASAPASPDPDSGEVLFGVVASKPGLVKDPKPESQLSKVEPN
jgi:hypothetical protein